MFRPVPRFSFQSHRNESDLEHLSPDPSAYQYQRCKIVEVYDVDRIEQEGAPEEVQVKILNNPGYLFAKVVLPDARSVLYLPFADPEDIVYLTYGNSVLLEGRHGIIRFTRNDSSNGEIIVGRTGGRAMLSQSSISETYDIIGVL